jgi:hypothetical protein
VRVRGAPAAPWAGGAGAPGAGGDAVLAWAPSTAAHDAGRLDGFVRLSDVPAGGLRAGGAEGAQRTITLRLAPAALARASKEAGGLMVLDLLPLGEEGGAPLVQGEPLGALLSRLHAAVLRGEAPALPA